MRARTGLPVPLGDLLLERRLGVPPPQRRELIERSVTTDDLQALYDYQNYIAEQVPVIFTPNFPIRLFEVSRKIGGFGPVNPFGMIAPENWY